jgi:hypothetical protein
MTAFNPTEWLEAFTADGGAYALAPDGRLWLGVLNVAAVDVERSTADLIRHPERREAIVAVIRERCLIA